MGIRRALKQAVLAATSLLVAAGGAAATVAPTPTPTPRPSPTPTPVLRGLVDVGGYSLSITCQGEGGPTVIFDSGLGGAAATGRLFRG